MHGSSLVIDIALVLAVAGVIAPLFRWLKQPMILGYLLAGLVVGPYLPIPLFPDVERIHAVSELGVVLVMFAVGLELDLRKLVQVLPLSGTTGLIQLGVMGWLGYLVGGVLGVSPIGSVFIGASLAISSTMVVVKCFEASPPEQDVRQLVFGVLVIQDVAAIALLAALSGLATGAELSAAGIGTTVARLVLLVAFATAIGLAVVPRFIRFVDRLDNAETLMIAAIGACFGCVLVAHGLGYSDALGAFLGGMLVAESTLARKVEHLIQPIRDVFAAIFFVSVGMTVNPFVAATQLGPAIIIVVVVVLGQLASVTIAGLLNGLGLRRAMASGLALGQIGEFAFIMTALGVHGGVLTDGIYAAVVTAAVITAFTTPLALKHAQALTERFERRLPHRLQNLLGIYEAWLERLRSSPADDKRKRLIRRALTALAIDGAVICVLAISTALTIEAGARWLASASGLPYTAAIAILVVTAVAAAMPFILGILRAARNLGLVLGELVFPMAQEGQVDLAREGRRIVVVMIQLLALLAVGTPWLALTQPFLPPAMGPSLLLALFAPSAIYFWRTAESFHHHMRAGTEVVLELLSRKHALERNESIQSLLRGIGYTDRIPIPPGSRVVGRSLAELHIRVQTGATVLAIVREDGGVVNPSGSDRLVEGDELAVAGSDEAIRRLNELLQAVPRVDEGLLR